MVNDHSQTELEKQNIETEPYYLPLGNEVTVFRAAFKEKLPVMLKGPTGCGKTRLYPIAKPCQNESPIVLTTNQLQDLSNAEGFEVINYDFTPRRLDSEALRLLQRWGIFFKAIVINIAGEPNLDALYGKYQHTLISNIHELPDKLLRIYGSMTRM